MTAKFANNAVAKLVAGITSTATSLSITPGYGARFPTISDPSEWFPLTVLKVDGTTEIMKCTARAGDLFTVVRAQEGTAGVAFAVDDRVELRVTRAVLERFIQTDGGAMTADLDMNSHKVTELADGTASSDAVNKGQLDGVKAYADGLVASGKNGYGARTVSTSGPSGGGADGDIWYVV